MTDLDLDRIERDAKAATQAKWDVLRGTLVRVVCRKEELAIPIFESVTPIDWYKNKNITHKVMCDAYAAEVANAQHIANMDPPTTLALVAALRDATSGKFLQKLIAVGEEQDRQIAELHEALTGTAHSNRLLKKRAEAVEAEAAKLRVVVEAARAYMNACERDHIRGPIDFIYAHDKLNATLSALERAP